MKNKRARFDRRVNKISKETQARHQKLKSMLESGRGYTTKELQDAFDLNQSMIISLLNTFEIHVGFLQFDGFRYSLYKEIVIPDPPRPRGRYSLKGVKV